MSLEKRLVVRQDWEESERGWGTRPDGYSLHRNEEDLKVYINEYWNTMPDEVPDEYSRPCGRPYAIETDLRTYNEITNSKNGIRRW